MPATPALDFTLRLNASELAREMARAGGEVRRGFSGMAAVAAGEMRRVEAALTGIEGFRRLKLQVAEAQGTWRQSTAEVARLGCR